LVILVLSVAAIWLLNTIALRILCAEVGIVSRAAGEPGYRLVVGGLVWVLQTGQA